jgi:hypothetical protein
MIAILKFNFTPETNNHPPWWCAEAAQYHPQDNAMKKLPYNCLLLRITKGIVWIALEANK